MEKNARVEIGRTPSIHSGRVSETEHDGEAVCEDELNKKASLNNTETYPTSTIEDLREWAGLD